MELLKNNRRFSFLYGGKTIDECNPQITEKIEGNKLTTVYEFDDGLKVTNIATKNEKFNSYEWVNWFENTSDKPTKLITEICDCRIEIPFEHEEDRKWEAYFPDVKTATKIFSPSGSTWTYDEFSCDVDKIVENRRINHIYPGETKTYTTPTGRSSEAVAPFFNISKNDCGVICAIGWSGKWTSSITRKSDSVVITSGVDGTAFKIYGGEKFRTTSFVMMKYDCGTVDAHNKWRRLLKENYSPEIKNGPFCAGIWGGMNTSSALQRIEKIKKEKLPFEYIWIDAGWYGKDTMPSPDEFEGDWPSHTGDWTISKYIHPKEMTDISKAIHDAGMKLILWFEPERIINKTPIAKEHPEYLLGRSDDNADEENLLLNLGNTEAWNYCFETISKIIEKLNIDCYRQDFNFNPLLYWQNNDWNGRRGISEIKHINGMYKLWDALREKFPDLLIDNCASGGRRIDIETLRRSIPLWRSDYMCPANYDDYIAQSQALGFNLWMPYSGTGSGRVYDIYRLRSAYAYAMTTNFTFSERNNFGENPEEIEFIKQFSNEYLRVRDYFSADFYPLTEVSDKLDVWHGVQFDRPENNDGMIEIFRRDESPYERAAFVLGNIDKSKTYTFTDIDDESTFIVSGAELCENGFDITIPQKRTAKIFIYKY